MTDPEEASTGNSAAPFLGATAIIVAIVIAVWLLRVFSGDGPSDEQLIGRAVAGQNDALQRQDYAAFRTFTCASESGDEAKVLAAQRQSVASRGERFVDGEADVAIEGDRATADVTYDFAKDPEAKQTAEVSFARESGTWKVCSTTPS